MPGRAHPHLNNVRLRRSYLAYKDKPIREPAFVTWLQVGPWFADIRVPYEDGDEPQAAFAGYVEWEDPNLAFRHQVSLDGTLSETDIGEIEMKPYGCLERGTMKRAGQEPVPFEEQWIASPSRKESVVRAMMDEEDDIVAIDVCVDGERVVVTHGWAGHYVGDRLSRQCGQGEAVDLTREEWVTLVSTNT